MFRPNVGSALGANDYCVNELATERHSSVLWDWESRVHSFKCFVVWSRLNTEVVIMYCCTVCRAGRHRRNVPTELPSDVMFMSEVALLHRSKWIIIVKRAFFFCLASIHKLNSRIWKARALTKQGNFLHRNVCDTVFVGAFHEFHLCILSRNVKFKA